MSTNDIERDLEEVRQSALDDLDPEERARLVIEQAADGNHEHVETLVEAAPVKTYEATDLDFRELAADHAMMALFALWELETATLRFFLEQQRGRLREANYDRFPDEDWTTEPSPENEFHEQGAMRAGARLSAAHLAWTRYAEEEAGVSLAEFLAYPFNGALSSKIAVIEQAAAVADGSFFEEEMDDADDLGGWAVETITTDDGEFTVEDLAARKYDVLTGPDGVSVGGV